MQDIPFFTSEFGVASLTLSQIPYTGDAYVRLQAASNCNDLLQECVSFCCAAGAEHIYATGHKALEQYPYHTETWRMHCPRKKLPSADAALVPVNPESLEQWRGIYNERMRNVPNAAVMTIAAAEKLLERNGAYFVVRDACLLGIGATDGAQISAIATVIPGSGADIISALNTVLTGDTVYVEVASENQAAIKLYDRIGFTQNQLIARWYKII